MAITGNTSALFFSAAGLRDATLRLNVTANNVANANTDGFVPDRVDSAADENGGVQAWISPGMQIIADSSVLYGNKPPSQTDYVTEGISLITARNAFAANARAFKAAADSERILMDAHG